MAGGESPALEGDLYVGPLKDANAVETVASAVEVEFSFGFGFCNLR